MLSPPSTPLHTRAPPEFEVIDLKFTGYWGINRRMKEKMETRTDKRVRGVGLEEKGSLRGDRPVVREYQFASL